MQSEKPSLPQIVLDYVDLIIRKMKYSRKVRHDVRAELLAHFEDALQGVDNEQDRQKQAEELICEFGDAKLLAVLIRRGKKRCRPMWQKALIRIFQTTCLLFLLLILYIGWFVTGKPVVKTNYVAQMNQLVRFAADDSQNAWPLYKEAAVQYKNPDANDFNLMPQAIANLDGTQHRILETWLADNQKAMELVRQGIQKPYYWRVYSNGDSLPDVIPQMISVLLPNLQEYKKLAQLFCWEAYLKAQKEDYKEAFDNLLMTYDFGRHLRGRNTTMIEQLAGFSIKSLACDTTLGILSDFRADSSTLAWVQQNFERIIATEDFTVHLESEKIFLLDELQRCFTQDRFGGSHLYLPRIYGFGSNEAEGSMADIFGFLLAHPGVLFTHPDRQKTLEDIERFYEMVQNMAAMTPAACRQRKIDFQKQLEESFRDNIFMSMLYPAVDKVVELGYVNQVYSEATLTILAFHRYKLDKDRFPASLEELVKDGYLKKIPMDPYSDKPIVYKSNDGDFVLYSIGHNFKDDGGQPGINDQGKYNFKAQGGGDIVFWPVHKEPAAQK
jgi:competence protein ComGC